MSTTTPDFPETDNHEDTEKLFIDNESNQFLFENGTSIKITSPHPLFDIPVIEMFEEFLDKLYESNADKTHANDYDGIDILCFKAKNAINSVLTIQSFKETSIAHTTQKMQELAPISDFDTFAARWFEHFVNKYNKILHEKTPDAYATLYAAAIELNERDDFDAETILKTIAEPLGVEVDVTA